MNYVQYRWGWVKASGVISTQQSQTSKETTLPVTPIPSMEATLLSLRQIDVLYKKEKLEVERKNLLSFAFKKHNLCSFFPHLRFRCTQNTNAPSPKVSAQAGLNIYKQLLFSLGAAQQRHREVPKSARITVSIFLPADQNITLGMVWCKQKIKQFPKRQQVVNH